MRASDYIRQIRDLCDPMDAKFDKIRDICNNFINAQLESNMVHKGSGQVWRGHIWRACEAKGQH